MKHLIPVALALAISGAPAAGASVVFDNLTDIASIGSDGLSGGNNALAESFYSPGAMGGGTVVLALLADPNGAGSATVYLVPDDGTGTGVGVAGNPAFTVNGSGAVDAFTGAQTLGVVDDSSLENTPSPVTFAIPAGSPDGNGEYWIGLLLSDDSTIGWSYSGDGAGIGTAGQSYFNEATGPGSAPDTQGSYQMTVDIPEPATFGIFLSGLAALGFRHRSRRC